MVTLGWLPYNLSLKFIIFFRWQGDFGGLQHVVRVLGSTVDCGDLAGVAVAFPASAVRDVVGAVAFSAGQYSVTQSFSPTILISGFLNDISLPGLFAFQIKDKLYHRAARPRPPAPWGLPLPPRRPTTPPSAMLTVAW